MVHYEIEIKQRIFQLGPPKVYSAYDFKDIATRKEINQVLAKLEAKNKITRIDKSDYFYPNFFRVDENQEMTPSNEEIARAIARKSHKEILCDKHTLWNKLGVWSFSSWGSNRFICSTSRANTLNLRFTTTKDTWIWNIDKKIREIVYGIYTWKYFSNSDIERFADAISEMPNALEIFTILERDINDLPYEIQGTINSIINKAYEKYYLMWISEDIDGYKEKIMGTKRILFYCGDCNEFFEGDIRVSKICPHCGSSLVNTNYQKDQWDSFLEKVKQQKRKEFKVEFMKTKIEEEELQKRIQLHKHTTGYSFEGFEITEYFGVVSGEYIVELDQFDAISVYKNNLGVARDLASKEIVYNSSALGGNAIIGISINYSKLPGKRISVIYTGTSVFIKEK